MRSYRDTPPAAGSASAQVCRDFHNRNSRQQRITDQSDCMICMAWLAGIHSYGNPSVFSFHRYPFSLVLVWPYSRLNLRKSQPHLNPLRLSLAICLLLSAALCRTAESTERPRRGAGCCAPAGWLPACLARRGRMLVRAGWRVGRPCAY
jgi:hypothetical protein